MGRKEPLWIKFLYTTDDETWDKDDLLDVLHWWKQFVAVVVGVVCGYCEIVDLPGVLSFLAILVLSTIIFYKSYLRVDQEEYGGHQELLADGMPFALGMFVLTWILVYTSTAAYHERVVT